MVFQAIRRFLKSSKKKDEIEKIRLGICAMDKKAKSKPMQEILTRLPEELFEIVIFGDDKILNEPVESWPTVDVLIAFYSTKFPTEKALDYVKLRKPYMINDLEMDEVLKDRRKVYEILERESIDVPKHTICDRDDPNKENVIEEFDEYIVVNGVQINKPLVEKPVDAEDHNIYIYYPMSAGGGSKRLFRKKDDRSSEFYPHINDIRKDGTYIYEEFVVTQGTDVKVYTVGPDYGHAEARKSPVVDGKVNRDSSGLEVRFPVILSQGEKEMARKIVLAFKQTVCGFDILRVQGRSYCCDVNGFSFVKNSRKYYDDASQILIEIMITAVRPHLHLTLSTRAPYLRPVVRGRMDSNALQRINEGSTYPSTPGGYLSAAAASSNNNNRRKSADDLPSLSSINTQVRRGISATTNDTKSVMDENELNGRVSPTASLASLEIDTEKEELRCIIGIVRHGDRTPKQKTKIAITEPRYLDYFHFYSKSPKKDLKVKSRSALVKFLEVTREILMDPKTRQDVELYKKLKQVRDVFERWEISGINRKLQMKPEKWEGGENDELEVQTPLRATQVLLIIKWGGDLTPLGRQQAEELGESFRYNMYPEGGGGMLRLHATYRHDLKIKASDEGRVMKTAAAFAKGLLELEGQLTPILASLVTVEEKSPEMLDRAGNRDIAVEMDRCKEHLNLLQKDQDMTDELINLIAPECTSATRKAMLAIKNPKKALQRMHELIGNLCIQLEHLIKEHEANIKNNGSESSFSMSSFINNTTNNYNVNTMNTMNTLMNTLNPPLSPIESLERQDSDIDKDADIQMNGGGGVDGDGDGENLDEVDRNSGSFSQENDTKPINAKEIVNNSNNTSDRLYHESQNHHVSFATLSTSNTNISLPESPLLRSHTDSPEPETNTENADLAPEGNNNEDNSDEKHDDDDDDREYNNNNNNNGSSSSNSTNNIRDKIPLTSTISLANIPSALNPSPESCPNLVNNRGSHNAHFTVPSALHLGETLTLMADRWSKLHKDFYKSKTGLYDLSKVPDIYDSIRYDVLHNYQLELDGMKELYELSVLFENSVVPQEYGIDHNDKRKIGSMMCHYLLEKIKNDLIASSSDTHIDGHDFRYRLDSSHSEDLDINTMERCVRTRLYFTSESHLHTLINVLSHPREGEVCAIDRIGLKALDSISELSYLTQVIIRLFEDRADKTQFRCEILLSPGAIADPWVDKSSFISPTILLNKSIPCETLVQCLDNAIAAGYEPLEKTIVTQEIQSDESIKNGLSTDEVDIVINPEIIDNSGMIPQDNSALSSRGFLGSTTTTTCIPIALGVSAGSDTSSYNHIETRTVGKVERILHKPDNIIIPTAAEGVSHKENGVPISPL